MRKSTPRPLKFSTPKQKFDTLRKPRPLREKQRIVRKFWRILTSSRQTPRLSAQGFERERLSAFSLFGIRISVTAARAAL
jgi:hypothetical protein